MKSKIYLLTILVIFLSSTLSSSLLFFYMDPESNFKVGIAAMTTACFLALSSFFALIIYFFKKIYYRGEVYLYTIHSSLRQGILLSLLILVNLAFFSLGILNIKTSGLLLIILLLIELMIQSLSEN